MEPCLLGQLRYGMGASLGVLVVRRLGDADLLPWAVDAAVL